MNFGLQPKDHKGETSQTRSEGLKVVWCLKGVQFYSAVCLYCRIVNYKFSNTACLPSAFWKEIMSDNRWYKSMTLLSFSGKLPKWNSLHISPLFLEIYSEKTGRGIYKLNHTDIKYCWKFIQRESQNAGLIKTLIL